MHDRADRAAVPDDRVAEAAPGRSTGSRVRAVLQIVVGVLTIALLTWAVVNNWDTFIVALGRMDPWLVAVAGCSIGAGLYVNMLSWRSVVAAFGTRLGLRAAARVFFVAQLTKYLPGGVWPIVVSARTGRAAGLAPRTSVISMTVALLVSVTVGAVIATGALFLVPLVRERYWWAPLVLLAVGAVALAPPVLDRLIALALRVLRRDAIPSLRSGPFAAAIAWSVLSWALLGSGLALLVAASFDITPGQFALAVASYAVAWVAGFVAVIAPAGAGVREIVLGLALGSFIPAGAVLSIVVVDRVLMTFGDVAMLLFTLGRRRSTRPVRGPLFVTRKFPPSVGGMETLAQATFQALRAADPGTRLIALGRSNANLVWWLPLTGVRLLWRSAWRRDRAVLFGDALSWAALGWIARWFRVPSIVMVHGLDVTYDHALYASFVRPALRRAPRLIAVSESTRAEAIAIGVDADRVQVVVLGLAPPEDPGRSRADARRTLERRYGLEPTQVLLATTGRLVRRKGVRWFVESVLPALDDRFVYLVAGTGAERAAIEAAARAHGATDRVRLLGRIDDADRTELLHGADLYVQPNIAVPGDVEGFGLVVTEASQAGLLTIVADREGLIDAVRDGVTGIRVPSEDAAAWVEAVTREGLDPRRASRAAAFQAEARRIYAVDRMGDELLAQLRAVTVDGGRSDPAGQRDGRSASP